MDAVESAYWDDINTDLDDPEFADAYAEATTEIEVLDKLANDDPAGS
jgi:hypothetical protein